MNKQAVDTTKADSCSQMLCNLLDQTNDSGAAILSMVERYIHHFSSVYCNLDFHDRQEIHQEVSLKLICHGEKVRDNCTKAWVYTVVRNQCINHIRKRNGQRSVITGYEDPEQTATTCGVPYILSKGLETGMQDQLDCLQKMFGVIESEKTGKSDITLYTLYAFGLSYTEISERSKRTVGAIGQRICLLKKKLSNLVLEHC
ncbi:RNA polymerase sigma factor [Leucothrix arctica]|uniref:RNA polymerase sigma-70 region 2 domain-containing protein n=1 Tax=Leucothrix arctica TaxID=1481894 RepID=A0A317C9G7_9GAMM|nr:sigma-70 family RNA polymerase sigma factor [Leucothrix arctica]PWQ93963.1 hypothetical protein DKT75_20415 [Leucothrix arctica]